LVLHERAEAHVKLLERRLGLAVRDHGADSRPELDDPRLDSPSQEAGRVGVANGLGEALTLGGADVVMCQLVGYARVPPGLGFMAVRENGPAPATAIHVAAMEQEKGQIEQTTEVGAPQRDRTVERRRVEGGLEVGRDGEGAAADHDRGLAHGVQGRSEQSQSSPGRLDVGVYGPGDGHAAALKAQTGILIPVAAAGTYTRPA
jgi:hypothetical protein